MLREMKENTTIQSPILYLQRQYDLLRMEYEYEKEQFKQQTELMGIGRKIKRGMCWYPLNVGRSYYNALNQLVVEVERREDKEIEHLFEYGRPVCFFTQELSGKLNYLNFTATVNYVDEDRMVVILPNADALLALQSKEVLGVQLYFDETSYRLMFEALKQVIAAKNNRLAELRDIFHGSQLASSFSFQPMRFPWLNRTQEEAVNKVLHAKDVAIVHGPPGTGKTTTDKMLSFTYERRFEAHPDYPQLWSIRKAIRELYSRSRKGAERESVRQKINSLKDRATELEIRINESLFAEARVIACTLVGSANRLLMGQKYGTLFIDEAAQALEPACWIPIRKADRVILAGDHCQLPPTVKCLEALRAGLGDTLMQLIVRNKPGVVSLLKLQYRMNDEIMRFSSDWFYGGMLQSAPEVKYRSILDFDTPIEWVNTEGMDCNEEFVGENYGRINKPEAELSVNQLKEYITRIGRTRFLEERIDVGLISPYKAQVQYLRQLLKRDAFFKPFRPLITVNTVDGFQGQERDVILISLVRANEEGQIGFLNDLRRMNVAITRARMKLIILGDASTLTKHAFYKKLYEYIQGLNT